MNAEWLASFVGYTYAGDDPVNGGDPSGMHPCNGDPLTWGGCLVNLGSKMFPPLIVSVSWAPYSSNPCNANGWTLTVNPSAFGRATYLLIGLSSNLLADEAWSQTLQLAKRAAPKSPPGPMPTRVACTTSLSATGSLSESFHFGLFISKLGYQIPVLSKKRGTGAILPQCQDGAQTDETWPWGSTAQLGASVLSALVSLGVFVWAVYKNFAIGIHASDTKTSGAPDQIVWLWLFASFAVLVASDCPGSHAASSVDSAPLRARPLWPLPPLLAGLGSVATAAVMTSMPSSYKGQIDLHTVSRPWREVMREAGRELHALAEGGAVHGRSTTFSRHRVVVVARARGAQPRTGGVTSLRYGQGCAGPRRPKARRLDRETTLGFAPGVSQGQPDAVWAYHDGADLGKVALAKVAKDYGYEPSALRLSSTRSAKLTASSG